MKEDEIIEYWNHYNQSLGVNISLERYKEMLALNPTVQVVRMTMDLVAKDVREPNIVRNETIKNITMEELEKKLRNTLDFFLNKLTDDESRDFLIQLILRDVQEEIKDIIEGFYYGKDLEDPEVLESYKHLLNDLKQKYNVTV